jgi:mannose/cellobiose epimerase-like protein (N-acyl-D-glucosamine 2-epimerase family)
MADIHQERTHAMAWLSQCALPFWTTIGYDSSSCLFHERVTFDGRPLLQLPRRLMVQCRQMYVLAHANLIGMYDGHGLLQRTFARVLDWYSHRNYLIGCTWHCQNCITMSGSQTVLGSSLATTLNGFGCLDV